MKTRTGDMTKGAPLKVIAYFAVPLFAETLFLQAYNLIDTMIAGHKLGDDAIAAIGATAALYSVLIYFANGMNNGFGVVMAQLFGEGNIAKMKKAAAAAVMLNAATTLLLTAAVLPFLGAMLKLLDTPSEIFEMSYRYIFIILAGMTATIAYNMCAGFMRAVGNSRTPLFFLMASGAVNIALDLLFVIVLDMGVAGAAAATVAAQLASALFCAVYIVKKYRAYMPSGSDWKIPTDLAKEMLLTGSSMGLMSSVLAVGSIILQKGINNLGKELITAHTASRRIFEFLMMPLQAIANACAVFVGQNFGAKRFERIDRAMKQVLLPELAWSLVSAAAAFSAGGALVRAVTGTDNAYIIANAVYNLRVCTLFFFPLAILFILRNSMQAMGYKIAPVFSGGIELAVKILSCALVIPSMKYKGVVFTEPIIWSLCAAFLAAVYLRKKLIRSH
ncbi:MAG: MATE family efflux transporter [Butyrivibrio sp.]|nr:MATE family efflux transporter [Butyrivibrio sp.]